MSKKEWRKGGPYPKYDIKEYMELTDTYNLREAKRSFQDLVKEVGAEDKHSSRFNVIPPYYSFIEQMQYITDDLLSNDLKLLHKDVPYVVMRSAVPEYWDFVSI